MSEFNVGDKVYLECEVQGEYIGDNAYVLRYKNWHDSECPTSFVADDVLHTPDELYNRGLNDAWELAKKIILLMEDGGYSCEELENIFGYRDFESILKAFTPQEALAKVKECNEIKAGDVVTVKGCTIESIVTKVSDYAIYRLFKDGSVDDCVTKEDLEKTGRHFDSIDEFIKS